ncbi:hypothetical protein [Paenibacillus sp. DMB20]|uniref:hypothetical protein n=1 Tax=Paenibacillus sp. DMB20 TaxID=1642570 RepID=UPI0006278C2A|nr:hypothetical protein [Paenibacillus sp. DMB20]KKO51155.1 hypothetical protein XI25_29655 [Paenibacillus sp. DMB20]
MAYWQAARNSEVRQANNFSKGLDTEHSPFFVDENTIIDGYGFDFDNYPALQVRAGRTNYGNSGGAKTNLLTRFGNTHLVRAVGTRLQYNSGGTAWTDIPGSYADIEWSAANFDLNGAALLLLNPTDGGYHWTGSSLRGISSMPKGKYITSDNLRVYVANKSGEEDYVYYSAFQDALDWTTPKNSGAVQYYTASGGPITGIYSYNGGIWVFKKDSYAIIYHTGSADLAYRLVPMGGNIGCVSSKTLVEAGPFLMWLGMDDVYVGAGDAARGVGEPIRKYLNQINKSAVENSFAFTANNRYYLCIPTESSVYPNMCLVYSYEQRQWLPYSANLPGMNWGVSLNGEAYTGDFWGQTHKMNNGTTDSGQPIPWKVQSRPFDEGIKEAEKELWELHLLGYFPSGSTLKVEVSPRDDGTEWYNIDYDPIANSGNTQNKNLIVPMDVVPLCHYYSYRLTGTGPATIQEVQRYSRIQPVQY